VAYELLLFAAIAAIVIACVPALSLLLHSARRVGSLWLAAVMGGAFWLLALIARLPIVLPLQLSPYLFPTPPGIMRELTIIGIITISALCAGLFEEGFKYWLVSRERHLIETSRHVLCLGLGWGLVEALLLVVPNYVLLIVFLPLFAPLLGPEMEIASMMIAGAVERNSTIVVHVAFSALVALAVWRRERTWLWIAILFHFLFDFTAVITYRMLLQILGATAFSVWLTEGLVAVIAVLFAVFVYHYWKRLAATPPEG